MGLFIYAVRGELEATKALQEKCKRIVKHSPKGELFIRQRKSGNSYLRQFNTAEGRRQESINDQKDLIGRLTDKAIAQKVLPVCTKKVKVLERLLEKIDDRDLDEIIADMPEKYQGVLRARHNRKLEAWKSAKFIQCPKNPEKHIHETICGEMVRSKSEVIIANALTAAGIPFHYEELFPRYGEDGRKIYPDFTIMLPNGTKIIWEHFGLLTDIDYCVKNAYKLHTYQHGGYTIGKNLILTQDDNKGNCSSAQIQKIIEEQLLPFFC